MLLWLFYFCVDTDGFVSQALLTGNFEGAVDLCFKADRMTEALILAVAGGPELFARTQQRYLHQARSSISKVSIQGNPRPTVFFHISTWRPVGSELGARQLASCGYFCGCLCDIRCVFGCICRCDCVYGAGVASTGRCNGDGLDPL